MARSCVRATPEAQPGRKRGADIQGPEGLRPPQDAAAEHTDSVPAPRGPHVSAGTVPLSAPAFQVGDPSPGTRPPVSEGKKVLPEPRPTESHRWSWKPVEAPAQAPPAHKRS